MNFRYIFNTISRIFLFKNLINNMDNQNNNNFNQILYNYNNLSFDDKLMLHSMINIINN